MKKLGNTLSCCLVEFVGFFLYIFANKLAYNVRNLR